MRSLLGFEGRAGGTEGIAASIFARSASVTDAAWKPVFSPGSAAAHGGDGTAERAAKR